MSTEGEEVAVVSIPMESDPEEATETNETQQAQGVEPTTEEPVDNSDSNESLEIEEAAKNVLEQAGIDMSALTEEVNTNGELSSDSFELLEKAGFPKDLVNNYIAGIQALNAQSEQFMSKTVYEAAGSQEQYHNMTKWAAGNMTQQQIDAFNSAINSGSEGQATLAVAGLRAQFNAANGNEGATVQGLSGSAPSVDFYENKAAMVEDLMSNKYMESPSYRSMIDQKIARSIERHGGSIPT
tara:strand:+ start:5139 stop:5858 length:720 start_codon:yes stop_codon:yes gene_type:complete